MHVVDDVLGELTWAERTIIRRIRLGWTKADLAERSGISRMTLWRAMECNDPARRIYASDEVRANVDACLAAGEAARAVEMVVVA